MSVVTEENGHKHRKYTGNLNQIKNREWKIIKSAMKAKHGCKIFAVEVLYCAKNEK